MSSESSHKTSSPKPEGKSFSEIHEALRSGTRESHDSIEKNPRLSRLLSHDLTRDEYTTILKKYYGFFEPLETEMMSYAWRDAAVGPMLKDDRLKTAKLVEDLTALGLTHTEVSRLPRCPNIPQVKTRPEVIGALYVLEGSNLGGNMIAKHLEELSLLPDAKFFNSEPVGKGWRAFLTHVASLDEGEDFRRATVKTALETFKRLDQWMAAD